MWKKYIIAASIEDALKYLKHYKSSSRIISGATDLMLEMEKLTGNGVVLNTSLNRRGEPMICSPADALDMFFGSDLRYLIMEDVLVTK